MNIRLKPPQGDVFLDPSRFRVLAAGRRFGKTYLAQVELCREAWDRNRQAWYVAPTYRQAKRIAWGPLKQMTKPYWARKPNETDLTIELVSGGTISLRGADNYDSLRGSGLDFIVLDEYASMAAAAWTEVLRPALADKQGKALFIGTPRGHNHFFELYEAAQNQPNWAAFRFTTEQGGNVRLEELESASQELDERTYRQEFQASFENLGVGLAYYSFDRANHVRKFPYSPHSSLFWALDFNMNPLCSVIGQNLNGNVLILDELILPDSNTRAACEEFLARSAKYFTGTPLSVYVYGDATGAQHRTSASRTDWQIIKDFFGRYPERFHAQLRVPASNPLVKDRINCVNAMLRNNAGNCRLYVNGCCKHLIKDFEQVSWKADPYGNPLAELNKSDPMRTHVSDAVGYMVSREYPIRGQMGERPGPRLV